MSPTAIRVPVIQGLPDLISGSIEIRYKALVIPEGLTLNLAILDYLAFFIRK
jgi:hypothetical protein